MTRMTVIDGIRYRPEDAPRQGLPAGKPQKAVSTKTADPRNKAAKPDNK